jgi:Zn-dependent protease with chaperone function
MSNTALIANIVTVFAFAGFCFVVGIFLAARTSQTWRQREAAADAREFLLTGRCVRR